MKKKDYELLGLLKQDITELKSRWLCLENEIKTMNERNDQIQGSVAYLASEYDDFLSKIKEINKENRNLLRNMKICEETVNKIGNQQIIT